jgi:tRNA (guanine37-N1)-methyltransferase
MHLSIFTIFPDFFTTPMQSSILKRAQVSGEVTFEVINIRDFTTDKHKITDDRPFGGGPGMVMMVEPIDSALAAWRERFSAEKFKTKVVLTSAKGRKFEQNVAREYAAVDALAVICGHYEGVDERVAQYLVDEEVRIGDFVLTGGEPAALVMADAVTRLLPGVLGNAESNVDESHNVPGQLGFPQYTRPAEYKGWQVPEVLLGGHHAEIEKWRESQKKSE